MPKYVIRRTATGNITAIVLAGLLIAVEMWTIIPGATFPTLILAVAVPELAPWGVAVCLVAIAVIQGISRNRTRRIATTIAALALGCAIVPLVLLNATIASADREMGLALGTTPMLPGHPRETAIRLERDLAVRTRDGAHLGLDLYRPAATGKHPTVIVIYGGAWRSGTRGDVAERARAFASLGYTTVAIDYRHAPVFRYPMQLDDVQDALAAIAKNAARWDVDPARVAIVGYSSGGELALLAAYAPQPLRVRAVVAFYSPIDLTEGYVTPPVPDPADVRDILTAYIGGTPQQDAAHYVAASPIAHVRRGLPPTLLIGGGRDELVLPAFQREMRDRLRRAGVPVASVELPWSNHVFDEVPGGLGGHIASSYTERFLAATL